MRSIMQAVRPVLIGGVAGLVVALAACGDAGDAPGDGSGTELTVSVGRQPFAAGNSPVTQYMFENELFEEAAREYGYDLTVEYQDFPTAAPQVEAMIADRLDIGMWGNTPVVRAIAQDQAVSVIGVGEGSMRFLLLTRDDTGITDISGLEGTSIGVTIGGDPHLALLQMLDAEFGTSDVGELGINLVDMPTPAASAQVPQGVDATITIYPAFLSEQAENDSIVPIANSYGETEAGYSGPLGDGEGLAFPSAEDSLFAPEGFYSHRSFWVARDALVEEHPEVIAAFTQALQTAIDDLGEENGEDVAALVTDYWGEDLTSGAKIVEDELLFRRGWAWATNGDGQVLMKLADRLAAAGVIDAPLTWEETMSIFELPSDAVGTGYADAENAPAPEEFDATGSPDARGAPQWELDAWEAP